MTREITRDRKQFSSHGPSATLCRIWCYTSERLMEKWSQPACKEFTSITILKKPNDKTKQTVPTQIPCALLSKPTIMSVFPIKEWICDIAE